jgi:hypothetical protein
MELGCTLPHFIVSGYTYTHNTSILRTKNPCVVIDVAADADAITLDYTSCGACTS